MTLFGLSDLFRSPLCGRFQTSQTALMTRLVAVSVFLQLYLLSARRRVRLAPLVERVVICVSRAFCSRV